MKPDLKLSKFLLTLLGFGFLFTFKYRMDIADQLWQVTRGLPKPWAMVGLAIVMFIVGYSLVDVANH